MTAPSINGVPPRSMLGLWTAGDTARLQEAIAFASRAHRNQVRRDARTPYASHVVRVMTTCAVVFGCTDPVALTAAALHDTIEDTTTDFEDIEERFGRDVADCVSILTKNMALPEAAREHEYDARLAAGPWQARLVKLADVFDNLCDIESYAPEKREAKRLDAIDRAKRAVTLAMPDAAREPVGVAIGAVLTLLEAQPKARLAARRRHGARKRNKS
ncbi:MAG: HD domain-containing protein [Phycisphaerales bacterium]